jgi:putative DNA methylase
MTKRKLIEVALPLLKINEASAREKSIRHGHPSTLHLWWARRPLAAARAVIWASLVDDPSSDESLTVEQQGLERERLFGILERLVVWENTNNASVLAEAKAEIDRCFDGNPPAVLDPFGGGGAIPLEAQRLGLKALSGDLNPVAVLIQRAMIEIPGSFANRPPVNPLSSNNLMTWSRAQGLAADIEVYGSWMRDEARKQIGDLYPDAIGPSGERMTPVAWIWARTVKSPDPSWDGEVPLVASWTLADRAGKPPVWVEPIIDRRHHRITYRVRTDGLPTHARTVERGGGTCLATGAAMPFSYIRPQFQAHEVGQHLMAIVADGENGRAYVDATDSQTDAALMAAPTGSIAGNIFDWPGRMNVVRYGMETWESLFSPRQLTALTTFSDLLPEVRERVLEDATERGMADDGIRLRDGGSGATAYADAVVTYLAFVVDKCADYWSTISTWAEQGFIRNTFARQAIPMTWDFAECNPFSGSTGNWMAMVEWVRKAIEHLPALPGGVTMQRDARARVAESVGAVISSDPPYYDNISYADLSDFFFVWLRKNLKDVWPDECSTLLTPKADELIANRYRAGSKAAAEKHFESGMAEFMAKVAVSQHPDVPATIYYAYKATETKEGAVRSTGWDTFLQAVVDAGMHVTATWPLRTEKPGRMIEIGTNALASSIVLSCRPRPAAAPMASRGEFVAALRAELPDAVKVLQSGNIAPVDLPQSTMGPGIGVFSRYSKVVESDGSTMKVSAALAIIDDVLSGVLDGEESEMDRQSRFALSWYSQYGYTASSYGGAEGLATAKNTSVSGVCEAGIGETRDGKFRLLERGQLNPNWSPTTDDTLTVWEAVQYLIAALDRSESEAAHLLHQLGGFGERARVLAYLLHKKASDKGWAAEANNYNALIVAWPTLRSTSVTPDAGQQTFGYSD